MFLVNGKGSIIRLIAGIFVLGSVILSVTVSQYFLYFTGLVGTMLIISATTGFCPMELILKAFKVEMRTVVKTSDSINSKSA
ncbi:MULTISPECIES: DUF2892 domain-containing protein [unclassified Fusibacter]|uniref:YgaP family membrane protein n=1 Tax=unclassified Fusibacter TaxID=2624464 RepID=UPI001012580F|nr:MULTISPECIES: DUF2892 domain-containing protein [unclassified Fusibacter]MCK8058525.1 DUF2892 domain-containing protein [Fusibacter sp. A2]NPE22706.1 DUF2892 domain-containing protein [Fusibacter sp. A1]RXV60266.1 DUF2892 domain-containing protein [Fusibacter sp. A1]